jgi:hypothetical protein
MASTYPIIPPTAFPRLDTTFSAQVASINNAQRKRRDFHFNPSSGRPAPKGKQQLLKAYARFISTFVGDSEVCFEYALRNSLDAKVQTSPIQAGVANEPENTTIEESPSLEDASSSFGFGLEILADPECFDTANVEPQLHNVRMKPTSSSALVPVALTNA